MVVQSQGGGLTYMCLVKALISDFLQYVSVIN